MLLTGGTATEATALCAASPVTCRFSAPPPPAESMLVGNSDRPEVLKMNGAVTRPDAGAPALANSMLPFPSMEVMGSAPPEVRAGKTEEQKSLIYIFTD